MEFDVLKRMFDMLEHHYNTPSAGPQPHYLPFDRLKAHFNVPVLEEGISYDELLSDVKAYLNYAVRTHHKQFFNQLFSATTTAAQMGEMLANFTNTTTATFEAAPAATLIEQYLTELMSDYVGFSSGSGLFVSGGSQANMVAALCARNQLFPAVKVEGCWSQSKPLVMFVSDHAHYSVFNAADTIGIGEKNVVRVATNALGQMLPHALEAQINRALSEEKQPFFNYSATGTALTGAFDPLDEISEIAHKNALWLHVDAAFGGSLLLSSRYRSMFAGIEKSQSVSWDPHKLLGVLYFVRFF